MINNPLQLSIAHLNDTHSYLEPLSLPLSMAIGGKTVTPYVSAGGVARIKTKADEYREIAKHKKRDFLFLHAGDCFQGTLFFSLFKGRANAHFLNELGIDAMTVGNHELDIGNEIFAQFSKQVNFPILAGNWDLSSESQSKSPRLSDNEKVFSYDADKQIANCLIKEFQSEKLAIMGLSIDRMADIASPDADTPFVSAVETAQRTVSHLHGMGINKIILLSHLGYEADKELAAEVDGISLIVGGHSHVLQGDYSLLGLKKEDDYGIKVNDTFIVQSGFYGQAIGHCEIDFAADGTVTSFEGSNQLLLGRRLFIDADREEESQSELYNTICDVIDNHPLISVCRKDARMQEILTENYQSKVNNLKKEKVASLSQKLRHVRIPDEYGASEVAPLVAKSFYMSMRKRGFPVQFSIHNAGGVRCSLQPGGITAADIAGKLLPFAIPIGVYFLSGRSLYQTIEGAINNALSNGVDGTGSGSYPYTYGLRYEYNSELPAGKRVVLLQLNVDNDWISIDKTKVYCGTSSSYTMKGKEGYDAIISTVAPSYLSDVTMADAFIESLRSDRYFLNISDSSYSKILTR
ncbi:bifunctional metallophosphatase/5'-nucleotidase [Vibrio salinus]|uniref:bifunctional metallophosphatase/5'-nucleotidase n=1 Tax=Vibrio salinus TaxID=2899784 RepID=UPI001E638CB5|nr:5'-nucleotidase C-terminal domain-containing protein [Vibrio salinus]MCE0495873.1 5'-nucleotidase C-terminal domain-containing protein [Vibrio salinus]